MTNTTGSGLILNRRTMIGAAAALVGAPAILRAQQLFAAYPFRLGIAAGDPAADGFVIWTRLAPDPLAEHGGMPMQPVEVEWQVATPLGTFGVRALLDDQELDSRSSTGAIYWEGLSLLVDAAGRRVGRGYLEMTGYAARLVL